MTQAQFNLEESEIQFLNCFEKYGFRAPQSGSLRDRDELISAALKKLRQELETQNLEESANLYSEIYEQDLELQELTESALLDLTE